MRSSNLLIFKAAVFFFTVLATLVILAFVPFLLAWNYVAPLFALPYLDWTQAIAILVVVYSIGNGFKSTGK